MSKFLCKGTEGAVKSTENGFVNTTFAEGLMYENFACSAENVNITNH
jgi:hypothetical protein